MSWRFPDARGWIGLGLFTLVVAVIALIAAIPDLRTDEFFKTIGALLVGAFVRDVVGWGYGATKAGGELAARNQLLVEEQARSSPPNS